MSNFGVRSKLSRWETNEESPDSRGQRTGEQPGLEQSGTESATENNRLPLVDKGENVR